MEGGFILIENITVNSIDFLNFRIQHLMPGSNPNQGHRHHFLEISLVKSGRGTYWVENNTYDMFPGDVFLFNNSEFHLLQEITGSEAMEHLLLQFKPEFIWSGDSNLLDYRFLKVFFDRNQNFKNRLERNNFCTRIVAEKLLEIENEFFTKLQGYELAVKVKLLEVLLLINQNYNYVNLDIIDLSRERKGVDLNRKIKEYIHLNISSDIKLSEIAKYMNMSESYLSVLFKKYNNINLWSYILSVKVYQAKQWLISSDKTILEIATLCGFNNTTNFNKQYKKNTGVTPSEFRKNPHT